MFEYERSIDDCLNVSKNIDDPISQQQRANKSGRRWMNFFKSSLTANFLLLGEIFILREQLRWARFDDGSLRFSFCVEQHVGRWTLFSSCSLPPFDHLHARGPTIIRKQPKKREFTARNGLKVPFFFYFILRYWSWAEFRVLSFA